jgi:Carboxypeptidase regulatory-like domain
VKFNPKSTGGFNVQNRASMILALFLVFSLMLSGCGGGGGGSGGTQNGSIQGWVFSNGTEITIIGSGAVPTGHPALTGATITLSNSAITATTNSDGLFRMDNVPPGDYTLTVTKDGLSAQFPITVKSGQTTTAFTGSLDGYLSFNSSTFTMIIRDSAAALLPSTIRYPALLSRLPRVVLRPQPRTGVIFTLTACQEGLTQ